VQPNISSELTGHHRTLVAWQYIQTLTQRLRVSLDGGRQKIVIVIIYIEPVFVWPPTKDRWPRAMSVTAFVVERYYTFKKYCRYAVLNKKVLSFRLNTGVSVTILSFFGRLFQAQGAATEKAGWPSLRLVNFLTRSWLEAERFEARRGTDEYNLIRSWR